MSRRVMLIGTSHTYQRLDARGAEQFRVRVEQACAGLDVRAIAEEASLEALAQKGAAVGLLPDGGGVRPSSQILIPTSRHCIPLPASAH